MKKAKELTYTAIIRRQKDGIYDVTFPDFPGCFTFGYTFEEAEEKAGEILSLWVEELQKSKKKINTYDTRPILSDIKIKIPSLV